MYLHIRKKTTNMMVKNKEGKEGKGKGMKLKRKERGKLLLL